MEDGRQQCYLQGKTSQQLKFSQRNMLRMCMHKWIQRTALPIPQNKNPVKQNQAKALASASYA